MLTLKILGKFLKNILAEPYSFLVNDTTLPSNDPLRLRKNLSW